MPRNHNKVDSIAIGERIRALRRFNHMNQEDLAEACELSTSMIGHIERAEKPLSLNTAIVLCDVFDISLDRLVLGRAEIVCDRSHCPLYVDLNRLVEKYSAK